MPGEGLVFVRVPKVMQSVAQRCFVRNSEEKLSIPTKILEWQTELLSAEWFYKSVLEKLFQEGYDFQDTRSMELMLLRVQGVGPDGGATYGAGVAFGDRDSEEIKVVSVDSLLKDGLLDAEKAKFLHSLVSSQDWFLPAGSDNLSN